MLPPWRPLRATGMTMKVISLSGSRFLPAVLVFASGCTHVGRFDARHFAPAPIAPEMIVASQAFILTTLEEDEQVHSVRPETFVGSAITLKLPTGRIAREAALRVFGEVFEKGATVVRELPEEAGSGVVITPRVTRVRWWFKDFGSTLILNVTLAAHARCVRGDVLLDGTYDSGRVEVQRARDEPAGESMTRAAHQVVQALMLQAGYHLRAQLLMARPG